MSMSFSATKLVEIIIEGGEKAPYLEPVFSSEETSEYLRATKDCDEPLVDNPAYRPEFDINLANGNANFVLSQLGYKIEDSFFKAPIDEFIERLDAVMGNSGGSMSPAIPSSKYRAGGGATIIHCGLQDGYLERTFARIAVMVREGKARGATMVSAA